VDLTALEEGGLRGSILEIRWSDLGNTVEEVVDGWIPWMVTTGEGGIGGRRCGGWWRYLIPLMTLALLREVGRAKEAAI
jgi:hypothetical protein